MPAGNEDEARFYRDVLGMDAEPKPPDLAFLNRYAFDPFGNRIELSDGC